ncbi:MAG: allophanate hydrolase subunit 1 [Paracoccaceae bacterium]|nr:MAG: allophanate hydrolase subunit 1 [Paracoccaceae bacterium]
MTGPLFRDLGDTALAVEFGEAIDPAAEAQVRALDAALSRAALPGVLEWVPTYRSLLVHFDPDTIPAERLEDAIRPLLTAGTEAPAGRLWCAPACYDPALAEDIGQAAALAGITPGRLADIHAGRDWRVAMFGFAPGFAYLSGCPAELAIPRRATPRPPAPPGSLMIAGGQALIAPVSMPTGWYVIGRTPLATFRPGTDDPFPLAVGDRVRFDPVPAADYPALAARAAAGEFLGRPA